MQPEKRLEQLDALRGMAAMAVFFYHCILLFAVCPTWLAALIKTPVGLLIYSGHQAVILFFLLSGFVLYLPYTHAGPQASYLAFILKRICRIYLPYLCALIFFVLAYVVFFKANRPAGLSSLYAWRILSLREELVLLRDHVLFIGLFHREYWNGATWTLAEEMRISLFFPVLALMVRFGSRISMMVAVAVSIAVSVVIHLVHHRTPFEPFHYASLFVLGAVLAANRLTLLKLWHRASRAVQAVTVCAAILVCTYAVQMMTWFPGIVTEEASDWLIALSSSVFLLAALADTRFTRFLRHRALVHLGRTSYGIYLLQLPVLFIFVNVLWTRVAPAVVFFLSLAATLALAQMFYLYVERPSMAFGKRLARHVDGHPHRELRPAIKPIEAT